MATPKQPININFAQGLNQKLDPWQLPIGQFQSLQNSVFNKGGRLTKRNGYGSLSSLPNSTYSYLTTLNGNLTALGSNIAAYNASAQQWIARGTIQPMQVATLPLIRNALNQTQCDSAIAGNGSICTVYTEANNGANVCKYVIANSTTGQNIVAPVAIPVSSGVVTGSPRVFVLGNYFIVVFTNVISGTSHLQYIAIAANNPAFVTANQDIASSYIAKSTVSWDGVVFNNNLYIAYNTTAGGQAVDVTYLSAAAAAAGTTPTTPTSFSNSIATMMTVCVDSTISNPLVYLSFYDAAGSTGYTAAVDVHLNVVLAPTQIISSGTISNLASAAQNGSVTVFEEVSNNYSYDSSIPTHYIEGVTVTSGGTVGTPYALIRSVGLGSKAFIIGGTIYFMVAFQSPYQPTYFLINGSTSVQAAPVIVGKLAYENGGGYWTTGLPGVSIIGTSANVAYLYKDFVTAWNYVNNTQQTATPPVYSQTGINLGTFDFTSARIDTGEIAQTLHLSGGFLGMYDGYLPVEHDFFLWPDSVEVSTSGSAVMPTGTVTSGSPTITALSSMAGIGVGASVTGTGIPANTTIIAVNATTATMSANATGSHTAETITITGNIATAQQYYYQVIYQWSDNQGNIHRSACSIPVTVTTTGTTSTNTINIPTLRLTMKTANPATIIIYRWSAAQEVYYQITSITAPLLNSTTVDSVVFYDAQPDINILGDSIVYTTGGTVEDVNAPATNIMTLFDTRLWLVDAEDPNLLWFSKQVIEAVPVEMSDLLTFYVAPNTGTAQSTGPITGLAPMDDKLIIFKTDAIYYINGTGPDNTGANSQYSQPIFITSTVGCADQSSIVLMNDGLMFQSDKGIWLLNRGLGVSYIGAPVEDLSLTSSINSANNIPTTNQVRSTTSAGQTLMYDYYFQQWATFSGCPAISSCIYNGEHTFINQYGQALEETPGQYLDGSNPVLMSFVTGWINLAALQGFERLYYFYLIGQYLSPHKLQIQIAYDYVSTWQQSTIITPNNFSSSVPSSYGDQPAPFGSPINLEQWKIHAKRQKCQSFQISVQEIYDPTLGVVAGAGLTLSGINMICAVKRGSRPIRASQTAG